MIYVTGDTHGSNDIRKLALRRFKEGRDLNKEDYVIVCGDLGLVWRGDREDAWWTAWLDSRPWTTLFVDGNHENHDMLDAMETEEWNGGLVHRVAPSVIHLMRGQLYDVDGMALWSFGGARSSDISSRKEGRTWWPREMPSEAEMDAGLRTLQGHGGGVDLIVTHDCPASLLPGLDSPPYAPEPDELNRYLQRIADSTGFRCWCFGHHHVDRDDLGDARFHALFGRVELLDDLMG